MAAADVHALAPPLALCGDPSAPLQQSFCRDSMVLQRAPDSATLWGYNLLARSTVTVVVLAPRPGVAAPAPSSSSALVAADGSWSVALVPQPATASGATITVSSSAAPNITVLRNVSFGEVLVCIGQSNMDL